MKNFICTGERIKVTAPAGGLLPGAAYAVGSKVGVVLSGGLEGEEVILATEGVFEMPKGAGEITQGAKLYLISATGVITTVATGNVYAGYAFKAAANADTTVFMTLVDNPGDVQSVPKATVITALGATTDLTAIEAAFADLAAARTAVNTLATETEARLGAIETKIDATLAALKTAGLMATA